MTNSGFLLHKLPVLFLLLIVATAVEVHAQDSSAQELLKKALDLQQKAEYDQSSDLLLRAAAEFKANENWPNLAQCYNEISFNARSQNKLNEAEDYAREVLNLGYQSIPASKRAKAYQHLGVVATERTNFQQALKWLQKAHSLAEAEDVPGPITANIFASIGSAYHEMGQYTQAMMKYRQGIALLDIKTPNHQKPLATLYNHMGVNHVSKGNYDQALTYYQKELELNKKLYGEGHPNVAGVYNNLAGISYRSGDIGKAINYYKNAAQSFEEAYGQYHPTVAMTYNNLGASYFQLGNLEQAIAYLEKSAEIKKKVRGPSHPDLAVTYNNIGGLYVELGEYEKAKEYLRQSLSIRKKALGTNHPKLTNTYSSLGNLFLKQQKPDSAISYFEREVEITRQQRGKNHPYVADALNNIARSYADQQFYARALSHHQQALQVLADHFNASSYADNPSIDEIRYPNYAVNLLYGKGKTLQKYYEDEKNREVLKEGLATFKRLSELLDFLQVSFQSEQSKLLMSRQSHEMYEHGIEIAHQLYKETGNSKYLNQAFYFAEKSKTRVILELIKTQQAKKFAGVPDSLIQYGKQLRNEITTINQQLKKSIDASGENSQTRILRDSLFALNQSLNQHLQVLENQYPRYHNLKFNQNIPEVASIQQKLRQQNLSLVEYFHGDRSTWAFVMDGNSLELTSLPYDSLLKQHVSQFRQSIFQKSNRLYFNLGSRLYHTLFAPITKQIQNKNLLVIPDGVLNLLPFEALLTKDTSSPLQKSFSDLPYLINKFAFSYSPSISLSPLFRGGKKRNYDAELAAFAPVFNFSGNAIAMRNANAQGQWSPLPSTKHEVQQIADVFSGGNSFWSMLFFGDSPEPKLFLQQEATEHNFKNANLSQYKYLHLATHAFAADTGSHQSGIIFHQNPGDTEDDILYAEEIYTLDLQSKLLVLSACETGTGEVMKGEGIIGLSRAFQYAGIENLLVSLWKVDDRSTARLMIDFYQTYQKNKLFNQSLRQAKRKLINHPKYAHPRYWAPFVFIGK